MFSINTCDVDAITVMSYSVDDCVSKRTGITTKLIIPFLEFILEMCIRDRLISRGMIGL